MSTVCGALATAVAYAPVPESDPRIVEALVKQLTEWRRTLDGGARRVGWKIGINAPDAQRELGISEPVIGNLTSATQLPNGATFDGSATTGLRVEPEVALHMGVNGEIAGYGAAIEIVDTGTPPPDVEDIVATNIFHRGFLLAEAQPGMPAGLEAELRVNAELRAAGDAPPHYTDVVDLVSRLLRDAGEELRRGDVIIAGSLTPPQPVRTGDRVDVGLGPLGSLTVSIA
jgi:2-keto-4-pentenoate hydratase